MKVNFDDHVDSYEQQTQVQTKFFNNKREYFDLYKVNLMKEVNSDYSPKSILDFGCGIGLCLGYLLKEFKKSKIYATDESLKSQKYSQKKYPKVKFLNHKKINRYNFDLIFISGVFHHVKPSKRLNLISTINKILNKNGKIFITEHNPFNPITQKIVSQCEYDKDANLISQKEMINLLLKKGFTNIQSGYYLFFPEIFKFFRPLEKFMRWMPLGGQYFIAAQKDK